jgi:hypothetical protein
MQPRPTTTPAEIRAIDLFLKNPIPNWGATMYKINDDNTLSTYTTESELYSRNADSNEASLVLFFIQILCEIESHVKKTPKFIKTLNKVWKTTPWAVKRHTLKLLAAEIREGLATPESILKLSAIWQRYRDSYSNSSSFFGDLEFDVANVRTDKIVLLLNTYERIRGNSQSSRISKSVPPLNVVYDSLIETTLSNTVSHIPDPLD